MKKELVHTAQEHYSEAGDTALFGRPSQSMKAQWNVPDNRPLADFAPTIILKAKDFATEITISNAREHKMKTGAAISGEHITNNLASEEKKVLRKPDVLDKE